MSEDHRELGAPLRHAAQVGNVSKHVDQRHQSIDCHGVTTWFRTLDLATAGVQVADHVAHIVFRRDNFHFHDRLHQAWVALAFQLAECAAGGDFECEDRRVNIVERTIN